MKRALPWVLLLVACDTPAPRPPGSSVDGEVALDRTTMIPLAAARLCAALDRCCDADSQERFFAPWVALETFNDLDPRLPPAADLSADECPPLVEELLLRRPFGAWLAAVDRGLVTLDLAAAEQCLSELQAGCGATLGDALLDATCFALGPPAGGVEQRRMFERKSASGPCTALDDGVGGLLYGTCDPTLAFCCVGDECAFPAIGDEGTCVAVTATGGACSMLPLQLCATGASCGMDDRCHAEGDAALALGAECIDDDFVLLGECVDGFCDVGNSDTCLPTVPLGEACDQPARCQTGLCEEGVCVQDGFCRG